MNDPIPEPLRGADVISWAQPVTRALNALSDKVGATARNERDRRGDASKLPWTFSCTISEENGEEVRIGGWTNCRLQIGLEIRWSSIDLKENPGAVDFVITGTDSTADGEHYLEVVLANGTFSDPNNPATDRRADRAEIKVETGGGSAPGSDYVAGIIRFPLGQVVDGKIHSTPHLNPVVYKYL